MKLTRRLIQLLFLALTVVGVYVVQGHAERWCPFGGVEALYTYCKEGNLTCSLGVSNFYILGGLLVLTLVARRAFCGYACPIGTISEWLQLAARRVGLRALRVPYGLDRALALLKYAVLGVVLYFTWRLGELVFRGYDPCYALISLNGEDISVWAYVISGGIVLASLVLMVPLCRWLCPLAAVFTPFSRVALARAHRDQATCVDCGACARACPMGIQVDKVSAVTAARCTSCLDCVAACPKAVGAMSWGPPKSLGRRWPQAVVVGLVLVCVAGAVAATYVCPLPSFVRTRGEAPAQVAALQLNVRGVKCRHSTEQFVAWLTRNDELKVRGYLRVEAWPGPGRGTVRIVYDPAKTNAAAIRQAIAEPRYDLASNTWAVSPYEIEEGAAR